MAMKKNYTFDPPFIKRIKKITLTFKGKYN